VEGAEGLTLDFTRLVSARDALARQYTVADLSPGVPRQRHHQPGRAGLSGARAGGFADWRLRIDGWCAGRSRCRSTS
jgi:hypothetical protein